LVSLKTYDSTSTYSIYLPDTNPKFLDGVSGDEQVADQVLTYDVATDKYVWKRSGQSEVFLQGTTTSVGSDENGAALTCTSEVRVTAGDPEYDPSLPADQQVFKVQAAFTDTLFNMSQFACGKPVAGATYEKTTGLYFSYSDPSVNPGGLTDDQKQAKDVATLTTKKLATGSEFSQLTCKTTDVTLSYENTVAESTHMTLSDNAFILDSKSKEVLSGSCNMTKTSCYPGTASNTATSMIQKPSELEYKFGGDDSVFKVDNATKKMETDMSCIEFGESSSKHRLKVIGGKLYIQKWSAADSKWVGAVVVIDQTVDYTATLTISQATVSGSDVTVDIAAFGGTGAHHWHIMLDDDTSTLVHVASGTMSHTLTGLYSGEHTVVAWPVNASHGQVGEKVTTTVAIA
jgi:hypothetical protein